VQPPKSFAQMVVHLFILRNLKFLIELAYHQPHQVSFLRRFLI
jgi:hypothetical protein